MATQKRVTDSQVRRPVAKSTETSSHFIILNIEHFSEPKGGEHVDLLICSLLPGIPHIKAFF